MPRGPTSSATSVTPRACTGTGRRRTRRSPARFEVATLLGCEPESVVFTASGSEADNLAIKGVALARRGEGDHVITSAIEHPAVLAACRYLQRRLGYRLTVVPVDGCGVVDPDDVRRAIEPGTVLVSVMHANNEVGTLQPIAEIARVARERGIAFHTDAAQSVGKLRVDVDELGIDLLTVTGHKMCAPKGIGALYVRPGTSLDPLIHGAGHEHGLRAGTENVPYIVSLGAACALAARRLNAGSYRTPSTSASRSATARTFSPARPRSPRRLGPPATRGEPSRRRS
jgi:cysteine desulfurase